MGWLEFSVAMVVFLGSHRIPMMFGLKTKITGAIGTRGYTLIFSLFSTAVLFWVIWAAGRTPWVPLWDQTLASRWAVNITMPVVILLASLGIAAPNPFAFEGRNSGFDPARPGIAGLTRQPLLWGLLLWSAAHLWANGDLAHVILFGTFLVFSLLGLILAERRTDHSLTAHTALVPGWALITGAWRPKGSPPWRRLAIAVMIWAGIYLSHSTVIGVLPTP
jgi:uncharacterized membrane protein